MAHIWMRHVTHMMWICHVSHINVMSHMCMFSIYKDAGVPPFHSRPPAAPHTLAEVTFCVLKCLRVRWCGACGKRRGLRVARFHCNPCRFFFPPVQTMARVMEHMGLFSKGALTLRGFFAKETWIYMEPDSRCQAIRTRYVERSDVLSMYVCVREHV